MTVDMGICAPSVEVVELDRFQWRLVRQMRLAALREAPHGFVSSWVAEWRLPPEYWQDRFTDATWVAAVDGEAPVGIARLASPEPGAPHAPYVESVWVTPTCRRRGVLRKMMDHLEDQAVAHGATELRLWVLDTNETAGWAYQKLGFSPVVDAVQDTIKCTTDGKWSKEQFMSKPLLP